MIQGAWRHMSGSLSFDRVASQYDATRGYPPDVARQIASGLVRLGELPPGARVLEIGIGTGRIALPLVEQGVSVTGIDIAPLMLEQLQANYEATRGAATAPSAWGTLMTQVADMTALPFADATFDAVIAVHVLHLVPEWRRALGEALRVIRSGGSFLLGQDVTATNGVNFQIQDKWLQIVRELGARPERVGARSYGEIVEALRERGLVAQEAALASWTQPQTPRSVVRYIADRIWSQTWGIPDPIFAESTRRLDAWVKARYSASLDTPLPVQLSFKAARFEV
jgi:ubiquinone/menaquinone biosynthesis C-methylase UbiE